MSYRNFRLANFRNIMWLSLSFVAMWNQSVKILWDLTMISVFGMGVLSVSVSVGVCRRCGCGPGVPSVSVCV